MLRGGEPWPSFLIIGQTVANQRPARRGGAEATRLATRGEGGEGLEGGREGGEGPKYLPGRHGNRQVDLSDEDRRKGGGGGREDRRKGGGGGGGTDRHDSQGSRR